MNNTHRTPIQLRFKDVDALGHVNNANHLSFFELARIHYFDDVIGAVIEWEKAGLILARATVDYKQPVFLKDEVYVYTAFEKSGTTSFELSYRMVRVEKDKSETLLATGTSVIVCYNYAEKKPVPVPKEWIDKMKDFHSRG